MQTWKFPKVDSPTRLDGLGRESGGGGRERRLGKAKNARSLDCYHFSHVFMAVMTLIHSIMYYRCFNHFWIVFTSFPEWSRSFFIIRRRAEDSSGRGFQVS